MTRELEADERASSLPCSWEEAGAVYAQRLVEYHVARGADPSSPHVRANVDNNTESIPARGDHLIRMLDELAGEQLGGSRVLDVGCGFGALAAYLAWRTRPNRLVASDISESLLSVATGCAGKTGLDRLLSFVKADMRDLSPLGDERFDIVIANGVIFYALTREDFRRALSELHRVLVPGGCLLFYHSNKWRWTDPFTGDPLVHLLPPALSRLVTRVTGWQSSHGRVRLVSPAELRRSLCSLGAVDVKIIGFGKQTRHTRGIGRYLGQRYVLCARRAA